MPREAPAGRGPAQEGGRIVDMNKAGLSAGVVRALVDAHRSITETKYLYLKILQTLELPDAKKAAYKPEMADLAAFLHGYFGKVELPLVGNTTDGLAA